MANQYKNKVIYNGNTLIDLTSTTATADKILSGYGAFGADGAWINGTATGGGSGDGYVWQDAQGYVHLSDEEGTQTIIDSLSVTQSGTYTAPTGHAYSPVTVPSGTEGTPTATKGTVSNNSVTVTPSVTNTNGFISGGTRNGTAVSVSASELVSGTKSITENGTGIDVTNYAAVNVAVPTGSATLITKNITANGTYTASSDNADGYSSVTVNVSGGGTSVEEKQINFIDYDGTILHSYTPVEWANVASLPSNPSHTGLTAQGWNWTKAQIDAQLTATPSGEVWVGQQYTTTSGCAEIEIELLSDGMIAHVCFFIDGQSKIYWGDGNELLVEGESSTKRVESTHTYVQKGTYIIKLEAVGTSDIYLGGTSSAASYNYPLLVRTGNSISSSDADEMASVIRKTFVPADKIILRHACLTKSFGMSSVILPNSITNVGAYAFYQCYLLKSITIPSYITNINTYAFYYCSSLRNITISPNVTTIGNSAFAYCISLKSVSIPEGATTIGTNVFQYCRNLNRVSLPSTLTSIGNYSFQHTGVTNISIPSGVTTLGQYCFGNCQLLVSANIASTNLTLISTGAFTNCSNLRSVSLPSQITSIGDSAFYNCAIESITLPNSLTSIGTSAFSYNSFSSITIPSGVTTINSSAFSYCTQLLEIHMKPTTPPTLGAAAATSVFLKLPSECVIYVPQGSLTSYQTDTNWSSLASKMQEETV